MSNGVEIRTSAEGILSDLRNVVNEILEESRFESGVVNRYVSFERARFLLSQNLESTTLKIEKATKKLPLNLQLSDAETMDDPTEGWYLIECSASENSPNGQALYKLFNIRKDKTVFGDYSNMDRSTLWGLDPGFTFICSMTSERDDLGLWRYYSESGGVVFRFFWSPNNQVPVYRVRYGKKAAISAVNRLGWVLKPLINLQDPQIERRARAIVRSLRFLFKPIGHSGDEEQRAIVEIGDPDYCSEYAEKALVNLNIDDIIFYKPRHSDSNSPPPPIRLQVVVPDILFNTKHSENAVILSPGLIAFGSDQGLGYEKEIRYWLGKRRLEDVKVFRSQHRLGMR